MSVIDSFRNLCHTEPLNCVGTIQPAHIVYSNPNAIVSHDTIVSDCIVVNNNIETLTCCENVQGDSFQKHYCVCLHSIGHQVDVLWIDSIVKYIQFLYLHPAVGDTVQGFYVYNTDRSTITFLQVLCK